MLHLKVIEKKMPELQFAECLQPQNLKIFLKFDTHSILNININICRKMVSNINTDILRHQVLNTDTDINGENLSNIDINTPAEKVLRYFSISIPPKSIQYQ